MAYNPTVPLLEIYLSMTTCYVPQVFTAVIRPVFKKNFT